MSFFGVMGHRRRRRRIRSIWVMTVLAIAGPALAQQADPPPEGFPAGRWVLAPYLTSTYEASDNPLSRSEANLFPPEADRVSTITGGIVASLPFRNSMLELWYEANQFSYDKLRLTRDLDQEAQVEFELNFGSLDKLIVRENYTIGNIDVLRFDPGGEEPFEDNPYNRNQVDLAWSRSVPRRAGYEIRLSRIDLKFDEKGDDEPRTSFFDYRGWDTSAEYRQPLSGRRWLTFGYGLRRFDHFEQTLFDLAAGEPTRREVSDRFEVGLRGVLGRDKPYSVRMGYGRFSYRDAIDTEKENGPAPNASDFTGFVAAAAWRIRTGGRSFLDLQLNRRALPSSLDTYYINSEIRARLVRQWLGDSTVGTSIMVAENRYGDEVFCDKFTVDEEGTSIPLNEDRTDRSQTAEFFLEWMMDKRVGFRLAAEHRRRSSSCRLAEYDVNRISAGVSFGWF